VAWHIARRSGAALRLIHVHVPSEPGEIQAEPTISVGADVPASGQERKSDYLNGLRERLVSTAAPPITYTTTAEDGPIAHTLARAAVEGNADLIVMTTHGRGGLARLWLGSVADDLIRSSPVPILALRLDEASLDFDQPQMFKQILIPLDGSTLAEGILEYILALGTLMQAEYILLQIVQPFTLPVGARFPAPTGRDAAVTLRRQRAAQAYLTRLARKLRATGARVRTRVRIAEGPAPAILAYARRHDVDLIAMSTHGHGGLRRLVLGSVADKVLRGANVPILLYRSRAHGEQKELTEGQVGSNDV
jgi:nucleotide-binding universal stress UspA family protein